MRLQLAALTLAEELNFTVAAERLRITQPALSKQITQLESRVGYTVFQRDQKKVQLTDAGQVLIVGFRDSMAILEKSIRLARSTHEDVQPVITIGHSPYDDPSLVSAFIGIHLPLYTNLRLRIESMFAHDLAHHVLASELDLAIISEPPKTPLLTLVPLAVAPLYVALPFDHPAAGYGKVEIGQLRDVGWMIFPRKAHPVIYDRVFESARHASVSPVELHHYVAPQEVVQLIGENFGVSFMSEGAAQQIRSDSVVVRPLAETSLQVTSYLALRADESSRLINEFGRAFLKKVMAKSKASFGSEQLPLGF
jgi:DNA-binding transcriptional LysR family regulator